MSIGVDSTPITPFQVIQIVVLVVGLGFTAVQLTRTARSARATNMLAIAKNHREVWSLSANDTDLQALLDAKFQIREIAELSFKQRQFINFVLHHMSSAYEMAQMNMLRGNPAATRDAGDILSLPAFRIVWNAVESYHRPGFRKYANSSLAMIDASGTGGVPAPFGSFGTPDATGAVGPTK